MTDEAKASLLNNFEFESEKRETTEACELWKGWAVAGVTMTGTSHVRDGTICQDFHRGILFQHDEKSWIIVAISDGAGSAPHSRRGAEIATGVFCDALRDWIHSGEGALAPNHLGRSIILDVQARLKEEAIKLNVQVRDLACTLLGVATGDDWTAHLQIGDGAIVYRKGSDWDVVEWPQRGEYANTTHFVVDDSAVEHVRFKCESKQEMAGESVVAKVPAAMPTGEEYALFTDGIQNLVLDGRIRKPHARFFDFIFQHWRQSTISGIDPEQAQRLLDLFDSKQLRERTDDDLTIITILPTTSTLYASEAI